MPDPIPQLTLYGDGHLVGVDPATASALVPGLAERPLTEDEAQSLLHDAEAACLLERDATLDLPGVHDVPGISFETDTGSVSHQTFVVGLGFTQMDANVPDDQEGQRAALLKLMDGGLELFRDGANPTRIERLGVSYSQADGPPTQSDRPTVRWPLEAPIASLGQAPSEADPNVRWGVVEGRDVGTLLAVVEGISSGRNPGWQDGEGWYLVELRPMLPDKEDCSALLG